MEFETIKLELQNYHKGQFIRASWQSSIESAAARKQGISVKKVTEATVRLGIAYSNITSVKEAKAKALEMLGEEKKPERQPWFRHMEDFPMVVEHKDDSSKKYLQMFTAKNANAKVRYFVNDEEISRAELERSGYCNPSAFKGNESVTFNIPLENLRFLGKSA